MAGPRSDKFQHRGFLIQGFIMWNSLPSLLYYLIPFSKVIFEEVVNIHVNKGFAI